MDTPKVLVADDDEQILQAIAIRLRANGYQVVTAEDAIQAVLRARQEKPDAASLDVYMPAGDGMAGRAKVERGDEITGLPGILVPADTQTATRDRGVASGARFFLTKPFETKELLACLEQAVAGEARKAA